MKTSDFQGWSQPLQTLLDLARALGRNGNIRLTIAPDYCGREPVIEISAYSPDEILGLIHVGARVPTGEVEIEAAIAKAAADAAKSLRERADKAEKEARRIAGERHAEAVADHAEKGE